MKFTKLMTLVLATVALVACGGKPQKGALRGVFSVSASKQVRFAQGNLQYLPATKTWQFAKQQYEYVGRSNGDISENYDGWIDLFGWGTSGWDNGGNAYEPTATGSVYYGEYRYGPSPDWRCEEDLTGEYANADWGVYNAISNGGNKPNLWRTLTSDEWEYLLFKRPNAVQLLALGSVNGVKGLFIMPDGFNADNKFRTLADYGYSYLNFGGEYGYSEKFSDYSVWNEYSKADFEKLQKMGVVFLPAGGCRSAARSINGVNTRGYYWTATHTWQSSNKAMSLFFSGPTVTMRFNETRDEGFAVRLVQDIAK